MEKTYKIYTEKQEKELKNIIESELHKQSSEKDSAENFFIDFADYVGNTLQEISESLQRIEKHITSERENQ